MWVQLSSHENQDRILRPGTLSAAQAALPFPHVLAARLEAATIPTIPQGFAQGVGVVQPKTRHSSPRLRYNVNGRLVL